jgi:hypothetical protein
MTNPPKLRSFVDHKPRPGDLFRNNPSAKTYVSHLPETGNLLPDVKDEPRSYVDHFAMPGDLKTQ